MNQQLHNKRQSLTVTKPVWANYSTDPRNFAPGQIGLNFASLSSVMRDNSSVVF